MRDEIKMASPVFVVDIGYGRKIPGGVTLKENKVCPFTVQFIPSVEYAEKFEPVLVSAENTPFPYDTVDHVSTVRFPLFHVIPSVEY